MILLSQKTENPVKTKLWNFGSDGIYKRNFCFANCLKYNMLKKILFIASYFLFY